MQDAIVGGWSQESHLSAEILGSLRDLNHRFLDWAAAGLPGLSKLVTPLSTAQREAAAGCPYALFDLRFHDDAHWRRRLQNSSTWCVADESTAVEAAADNTVRFVRLALFYAWHVASGAGIKGQLLLGMSGSTAAALRRITVNQLPELVVTEAGHLTARWLECTAFWSALMAAAAHDDPAALRRVQLHGLQLAAAVRLAYP